VVVRVSWSVFSVVGGENIPEMANYTILPAGISVTSISLIVTICVEYNPLQVGVFCVLVVTPKQDNVPLIGIK
jgi:hypothetical protein